MNRCLNTILTTFVAIAPLAAQQGSARVEQVAWLTGCWELSSPQRVVQEQSRLV